MGSKKKAKKPAAKKPAAKKPATKKPAASDGMTKKQKADLTRFARDIAAEYGGHNVNATVYKIRRALNDAPGLCSTILELGGRAWMREGFRSDIEDMIDKLPATTFRQPMTPEERAAAQRAKQQGLISDLKKYELSAVTIKAMRAAFASGYVKDEKKAAQAAFDKAAAKA